MLDTVMAVLDKDKAVEGSPSSEPGKIVDPDPKTVVEPKKVNEEGELSPDELKRLSVKAQTRYRALVEQRVKAETEVATLKPKAAQYDVITKSIRETGLDQADMNTGFEIMTLLKRGDLMAARAKIAPIWEQVVRLTGGVLPEDLAKEVENKALPENRARELAVARATLEQNQRQRELMASEGQARQAQEVNAAVVSSVSDWEKVKATNDPDWKLKAPLIRQALELAVSKGVVPKSAQEALQMAEKALVEVNGHLRAFRPAPRAIKTPIGAGSGASSRSQTQPKSYLDLVNQALG